MTERMVDVADGVRRSFSFAMASTSSALLIRERPSISSSFAMSYRCALLAFASTPHTPSRRPPRRAGETVRSHLGGPVAVLQRRERHAVRSLLVAVVLLDRRVVRVRERPRCASSSGRRSRVLGSSLCFAAPDRASSGTARPSRIPHDRGPGLHTRQWDFKILVRGESHSEDGQETDSSRPGSLT